MNRFDQRKITKNLVALRKAIQNDVNFIADKLYEQKVFSKEVRNEIAAVRPPVAHLQCGVLINKLLRSGKDAYVKFRGILEDMGHHDIVNTMERSVLRGSTNTNLDKEKTFVLPNPKIPERLKEEAIDEVDEDDRKTENRIDEVHQLERMMTFVLTSLDNKDKGHSKTNNDFKRELKQRLKDESQGNEELLGFFTSLRYNSFSLTSETFVH